MNLVVRSTIHTLKKSRILLEKLSDEELADTSVSPYYSSIGSHVRHILDFYDCVFSESESQIDLTARTRNLEVEQYCDSALVYLDAILQKLEGIGAQDLDRNVDVIDDLGMGKTTLNYTFAALLAQANSHTIHHYAIINYILDRLDVTMEDEGFGYNPTTPQKVLSNN